MEKLSSNNQSLDSTHIGISTKRSLIEQSEWYKLLIDNIQDYAIFLLDTSGNVASWNAGAQKFKGYKSDEIIGQHFSKFYTKVDLMNKKPWKKLEIAKRMGRVEDEGWRVRRDGTRFWANVVITALYDSNGTLQGFAKITRDLTERKKSEDAVRSVNRKLKRQQTELRKLNKSKDEFISLASHQLRTPATIVKQYLGIILSNRKKDLDPRIKDMVLKAKISNDRQIQIVDDLLKVARMDSGKVRLNKEVVELNAFIESICEEESRILERKDQTLSVTTPDQTIEAKIDPDRMRMVLENIINNASKYSAEGSKIEIVVSEDTESYRIAIKDTGIGIKKEDIRKLFKQFSRLQNEYTSSVSGSGLGLYWANQVVKLHGGKILVESRPGKGSTFTVNLPRKANRD